MKSKLLNARGEKAFAVVFDTGDEVVSGLQAFAKQEHLTASHFTAIGGLRDVTLGYFELDSKEYKRVPINEQVELLSLVGDIALEGSQPKIHAHVVVGKSDGTAHGGHLLEAHVRPTLEAIVSESPEHLRREMDKATGLALIRL